MIAESGWFANAVTIDPLAREYRGSTFRSRWKQINGQIEPVVFVEWCVILPRYPEHPRDGKVRVLHPRGNWETDLGVAIRKSEECDWTPSHSVLLLEWLGRDR